MKKLFCLALAFAALTACTTDDLDTSTAISALGEGFVYSQEVGLTTSEFQDADVFYLSLATAPTDSVTIGMSSTDTTENTVPSSVTFTTANWATPKAIWITGVNDTLHDGHITSSIVLAAATSADPAYNGLDPADVSVLNLDNDQLVVEVKTSGSYVISESGTSKTFKMRLPQAPSATVTCPLTSSDLTEGTISPSATVFTTSNWSTYQVVTMTGVDDAIVDGSQVVYALTSPCTSTDLAYDGSDPTTVAFSNSDND